MIRRILTVLGVATLLLCLAAVAPVQVSAAPVSTAPVAKTISMENGWEYVSAEQNALDQAREKAARADGKKVSSLFGCPDDYICLFHWINYQGGRWQQHPNILDGNCWNFSGSTYTDGYNVNNTSASLIINRWSPSLRTWVGMYDWIECNPVGAVWAYDGSSAVLRPNLGDSTPNAWHKFTSILVEYVT